MGNQSGKLDPEGMLSDESYVLGDTSENPERSKYMKKYSLKEEAGKPGGYSSKGRNFSDIGEKEVKQYNRFHEHR